MNGKILFTVLLMSFSCLTHMKAEAACMESPDGSEPPYKYMQKGIKTKLEDVKSAKSSKTSSSVNAGSHPSKAQSSPFVSLTVGTASSRSGTRSMKFVVPSNVPLEASSSLIVNVTFTS